MSTDYASKEREFLDSLKADTGRDCGEWMQAIAAAALPHRNDIIDWLRQQGFPFSRASWLERIHHNGGRPIYADGPARPAPTRRPAAKGAPAAAAAPAPATSTRPADLSAPSVAPTAQSVVQPQRAAAPAIASARVAAPSSTEAREPASAPPRSDAKPAQPDASPAQALPATPLSPVQVQDFFAPAKAYRPLAQYLLAAIQRELPGTSLRVADGLLMLSAPPATGQTPSDFAAILPSARDIRLGLDGGDAQLGRHMLNSRLPGAPAGLVHTVVLDDARQVNADLLSVVKGSMQRAHAKRG